MTDDRAGNLSRTMNRRADLDAGFAPSDGDVAFDPNIDPAPDPALGALLRELTDHQAPPPNWERLRRAINDAAAGQLLRRRGGITWWHHAASWAGRAIPIGLAASIALIFGLRAGTPGEPAPTSAEPARLTVDMILATVIDDAFETILPASRDELLRAAILIED